MKPGKIARYMLFAGVWMATLCSMYSFQAKKITGDVWQQLGLTEKDGTGKIRESFLQGWLSFYAPKLRSIATGDRKAIALDLLQQAKTTTQSEDFKNAYELERQRYKPVAPQKAKTEDELRAEQIASLTKSKNDLEKSIGNSKDENIKKILQGSVETINSQLADYKKPGNETLQYMAQSETARFDRETKKFEADTKKWEEQYPADVKLFIKSRLKQMLDATEGIDYNAQLTPKNGKMIFANPAYESKRSNWKLGFRAGKDVTETTRAFAKQWMSEL